MAVPAGTFQHYQAKGVREDLADIIYDISPMDTPFMSNVQRDSASQVLHEWQTDELAAATSGNAQVEGDDYTGDTATPSVRYGNYCRISAKVPRVSGTLRAEDTAGRRDELSYQIAKRGRELKRDIESSLLGLQAATAGVAASARVSAGVAVWLFGNHVKASGPTGSTAATVASGVPGTDVNVGTSAARSAFVEADLKTAIQNCWTDGGDPSIVMTTAGNKVQASSFTGIATQYRDNPQMAPAAIIGAADVYVSDFGTHQIVANRFMPSGAAYVLDMEYWSVAYLRPIQQIELAKTGDSDRRLILGEYTLAALAPNSSAMIIGLN